MAKLSEFIEWASPLIIKGKWDSLTISLSRRFFLFELMKKVVETIEDDPYLNFISLLKNYKILGKFLTGTVREFHRDRNSLYFRNFFADKNLYDLVKSDIEWLAKEYGYMRVTITKRGLLIYDNYKKNQFNVLLFTIHSGTWVPQNLSKKMECTQQQRYLEEDIDSHKLYSRLVLSRAGIWIDNKQSRFICDFNRGWERAIYKDKQESWAQNTLWKQYPSEDEVEDIKEVYDQFYFTLAQLTETHRFNIIIDGHTMSDNPGRPAFSFGTKYIPTFYLPIVKSMRQRLLQLGYEPVLFNAPYGGGNILQYIQQKTPDLFSCVIEINKKLFMTQNRDAVEAAKLEKLSKDLVEIFNLEEPKEEANTTKVNADPKISA